MVTIASEDLLSSKVPDPHSRESFLPIAAPSSLFGDKWGLRDCWDGWTDVGGGGGGLKVAKTGNDCPLFAGLREYLGVGTPPLIDSDFTGTDRNVALPPKFPVLNRGGGEPPSPCDRRRPTDSKGLRARRFVLLRVNSLGFIGASRDTGERPRREPERLVELRLFSCFGERGIRGLLERDRARSFDGFSVSLVFGGGSFLLDSFSSCWTLEAEKGLDKWGLTRELHRG